MGLILGSSLNLRNNPKLNPVLGVGPAPRVNNWVQSGSGWPSGSEIYQIIQFQAVLGKFNQLQLPINHKQLCSKLIPHSENLKRFFLKNPVENLLQIGNWRFHLNPSIELWKDFADALFFI